MAYKIGPLGSKDWVLIVCTADSHPTKRPVLQDFQWHEMHADDGWQASPPLGIDGTLRGKRSRGEVLLDDDDKVTKEWWRDDTRRKYNLKCPHCGMSLSVRWETIRPHLDKARSHGVSELPLSYLIGTISK